MVTWERPPRQTSQPQRRPYRVAAALSLFRLGLALVVGLSLTQGSVAMTGPELGAALLRQGSVLLPPCWPLGPPVLPDWWALWG